MTNRFTLKSATDGIHRELDDKLSRLDLAEEEAYRRFLILHAMMIPPLEDALADAGADALIKDWSKGRRGAALKTDLKALGEKMPAPAKLPPLKSTPEILGTAYVIEGSRLGGKVLRGRVGSGLPMSFLGFSGHDPWPTVVAALDELLTTAKAVREAGETARRCFSLFLNGACKVGI